MLHPRLTILFERHVTGTLSPAEEAEFQDLVSDADNKSALQELLDAWIAGKNTDASLPAESRNAMLQAIFQASPGRRASPTRAPVRKMYWIRRAAVAAVFILVGTGYWFFTRDPNHKAVVTHGTQEAHTDVAAPAGIHATLTLADGRQVSLDSATNGRLAMQGNTQVLKTVTGGITYSAGSGASAVIAYNTLSNPRGSKIVTVTLSDGTTVWLNNESTLRYPVAFTGTERRVEVTGEAYFEVTHDAKKKFSVTAGGVTTEVLGTHFNINAFEDEGSVRVTLLEGSVRVGSAAGPTSVVLKPGQQARTLAGGELETIDNIDPEDILAWKNGLFQMKGTDLAALLRQLSRWYNVEISYDGKLPKKRFGGSIDRNINLSDVLRALEQYGIRSRMDAGKVIIQLD